MECALTVFKSIYDNSTSRVQKFKDFNELEKLLFALSRIDGYKPKKDERVTSECSPLISPAVYKEGSTRAAKNVIKWAGWTCIDVDEYDKPFSEQIKIFSEFRHICYSTASSTIEKPKFRVVFPLSTDIPVVDIPHFWYSINREFGSIIDQQTKDVSRLFYVPAIYPNAHNFIHSNDGKVMIPSELCRKHEFIRKPTSVFDSLPEDIRIKILEQRKQKYSNVSIKWTSYRDCPFITRSAILAYTTLSGGWYHRSYKLMCSIAHRALDKGYPISGAEIAALFREIDRVNGNWYENRPIEVEAERALEYALKTNTN